MARLGIKSKLYRNTGSYGTPVWTEVPLIADLAVNPSWDDADASSRASRVKKSAKTMMGLEITGKIKVKLADAGYVAFRDAMYKDTVLDLLVLNGEKDEEGVHGWRAEFVVFGGNEDQAMGNVLYMDFTLRPACTDNQPQYAEVDDEGALAFTVPGGDA